MKELLKLIEQYEERHGINCAELQIFSDGSGRIKFRQQILFSFDKLEELEEWLNNCIK